MAWWYNLPVPPKFIVRKKTIHKEDGRYVILYHFAREDEEGGKQDDTSQQSAISDQPSAQPLKAEG